MKKKSASQSAFFNLRVLIGLFIVVAGVFLALAGFGTFSAITASSAQAQQKHKIINIQGLPPGFDCSTIHELGIDKMENLRAGFIMIACGEAQGGSASPAGTFSQFVQKLLPSPLAYGATDVELINNPTPETTYPHITQSETFSWANPDNPNQIVVAYNDSRCWPTINNISGASVSTDGGTTFTRLTKANGCGPFDNTFGDPVIVYNKPTATWYTVWIDGGCGGGGLGGYKSTTPWDPNSWTHFCVHSGGATWTNTYTGPSFPGPGVGAVGYFACMFTGGGAGFFWRHEGWGEPAAYNHVVSLVYAQHGTGADAGDVYYIRSTDSGVTFGAPFKLNTDATTRPQWQPNLSVSDAGTLFAMWYDARESASCTYGSPGVPCYRMFSRKSNDNGVTWLADDMFSDVVSPLPAQPDPNIQTPYAGDYDYGSAILVKHLSSWTDGRVTISGTSQQDAFTDRELVGFAVTSTDPACGSIINTQPTQFVVNISDPANPGTVEAGDFTVNGTPANSVQYNAGETTMTFTF